MKSTLSRRPLSRGVSALEFALVAPILLTILLGTIQCGIVFNNYLTLDDSVRAASRVLAASRSSATPYTDTTAAIHASAPNLTAASLSFSLTVNGSTCVSDGACAAALSGAAGDAESVSAHYPCNLTIMGVNYMPGCTLTATTTERIE